MSKIYAALEQARLNRTIEHEPAPPRTARAEVPPLAAERRVAPPRAAGSETEREIMKLFQALEIAFADLPRRVIQFISTEPGAGVSTMASQLAAMTVERTDRRVLLLRPEISSSRDRAVRTAPQGDWVNTAQFFPTSGPERRLHVAPPGGVPMTDVELLNAGLLRGRWTALKEEFDLIVLDTKPPSVSLIGLAIAPTVDGVILVVEAERTRAEDVKKLRDQIAAAGGPLLGVVFNKRRQRRLAGVFGR
jgi:protein-tyrosine kinase